MSDWVQLNFELIGNKIYVSVDDLLKSFDTDTIDGYSDKVIIDTLKKFAEGIQCHRDGLPGPDDFTIKNN